MKVLIATIKRYLRSVHRHFLETSERALDEAYNAALAIRALENDHFQGNPIGADTNYGDSTLNHFQAQLRKYLSIARMRLAEFNASQSVISLTTRGAAKDNPSSAADTSSNGNKTNAFLEKHKFIDEVLTRYRPLKTLNSSTPVSISNVRETRLSHLQQNSNSQQPTSSLDSVTNLATISNKNGVLPGSIIGTLNRIQKQLDPKAEEKIVRNFRSTRTKTVTALRFILLLIFVPLLAQQLSRSLIVGPIVDQFRREETLVFLNAEMQSEALAELQSFEESLRFQGLVSVAPGLSPQETKHQVQEKAQEINQKYRQESAGAIKNVFADLLAAIAFVTVLLTNKRGVTALKSFIDEIVYGLSDSAKAFIIILSTDLFVGFHSPHGWEVLLEGVAQHLGVAANHNYIFLFIATVPVIMDTILKYLLFRYLNSVSPSAVATLKAMNE